MARAMLPAAPMVDIHCHLLAGLDDGPQTLEESLQMAEMAIADGTTHVIATPHASPRYSFSSEAVTAAASQLRQVLGERLHVATGCDFHLSPENLQNLFQQPQRFTLNAGSYLLLELSDFAIPPSFEETLYRLQQAGLRPILTHPERNPLLRKATARLDDWINRGCLIQITAGALLGRFGPEAERAAVEWVRGGRVHLVASDAHNTTRRPPGLRSAYLQIARLCDERVAQALVADNPLAVYEDRPLPYRPEPVRPPQRRRLLSWF
jgi:protein-tyrosine phosphatase